MSPLAHAANSNEAGAAVMAFAAVVFTFLATALTVFYCSHPAPSARPAPQLARPSSYLPAKSSARPLPVGSPEHPALESRGSLGRASLAPALGRADSSAPLDILSACRDCEPLKLCDAQRLVEAFKFSRVRVSLENPGSSRGSSPAHRRGGGPPNLWLNTAISGTGGMMSALSSPSREVHASLLFARASI